MEMRERAPNKQSMHKDIPVSLCAVRCVCMPEEVLECLLGMCEPEKMCKANLNRVKAHVMRTRFSEFARAVSNVQTSDGNYSWMSKPRSRRGPV